MFGNFFRNLGQGNVSGLSIAGPVSYTHLPEANKGLGVKIFAALTAGAVVASEVAHGFHHHHSPEFYGERFSGPPHPYFKPGVDTPRDVAIRNFEAQMNQDINEMRRGR